MSDEIPGNSEPQISPEIPSEGTQPSETPMPITAPEPAVVPPIMIPKPRFDEVNQRMHNAEAELARLRNPAQSQEQPKGPPTQDQFASYEAYVRADAAYHAVEAVRNDMKVQRQQEQQQDFQRRIVNRVSEAESNWVSKVSAASPATIQAIQAAPVSPVQSAWIQIQEADNNVAVAEFLSKNPTEMARINQMYPDQQAREIAKLDVKLAASGGPIQKPSATVPDLKPVGPGKGAGSKHPDQYTQDDVTARLYKRP